MSGKATINTEALEGVGVCATSATLGCQWCGLNSDAFGDYQVSLPPATDYQVTGWAPGFGLQCYANAYLAERPLPRSPERVTNVVFMGMGEPLANYAHTIEAIRRMTGLMGLSARSITVSTVGFVPGIKKLTEDPLPLNLAVSLHSTIPSERSKLVPINDRYPIDDVVAAAKDYYQTKGRRISLEWTLIAGGERFR